MTRLRVIHRLLAFASIAMGVTVLHDAFTGNIATHWPLPLFWIAATAATALVYRRMRERAHFEDQEN